MDYILYMFRSLYRVRWWVILGTVLVTTLIYFKTKNMRGTYDVQTTLYTGVVSGYSIEDNNTGINYALAQNAIDNLINIIQAESTLKRVSIRLFSRVLVEGSPTKDQNQITSACYNYTYNHMKNSPHGKELIALIDKNSVDKTMENFMKYEKPDINNYIYGLFYFQHPYYSLEALRKVKVNRLGNSDLLKVGYASSDPGIAYNTIEILMKEFVHEYRILRYGETDKVIEFFKSQLDSIGRQLADEEDNLTQYNVENRIINYYDETKEIAAINKEFELREQDVKLAYNSSKAMLEELERQMDSNTKQAITNLSLIEKLKQASDLTGKISEMETVSDNTTESARKLKEYKDSLRQIRKDMSEISSQYVGSKYSQSGLARTNIVEQWLDQTLLYEKAKAEMEIVQQSRNNLNQKYEFYAPVGTTIKRKERSISFSEHSYLTTLQSYNEALMRKKSLEMPSASLKVLNPPAYPITTSPTNRTKIRVIACIGSFLLIFGFFVMVELIDRTLRDSVRTRKLTGCPIIGTFPGKMHLNPYTKTFDNHSIRSLSSSILRFFTHREPGKPYILNLLSIEDGSGRTDIAEQLEKYWQSIGLKIRHISDGVDFHSDSSRYLMAKNITDLYTPGNEDILIVEYPQLDRANIPTPLLLEAQLNVLVVSANYGWKTMDKINLHRLEEQLGATPYICLNHAPKYDLENFTGMLPPYTPWHRFTYRLSQLALTESFVHWTLHWRNKSPKTATRKPTIINDDDE